ncbi:MAG: 3-dehydroquinate synthase [Firmicutes bacterium]|nr:3-dehydroquinate synthase [Bacillota bacterium]
MRTVHIDASASYDILIGKGILSLLGEKAAAFSKVRAVTLVSDDNVYPLYGEAAAESLQQAGLAVHPFVFPHGEQSKSLTTYGRLLEFMDSCHMTRSDLIVALGGGVTGDLAGFAAATFQRGIRYIQVPTSLLAMVDSSVGGKTAIDLSGSKNQVGAFWQPALVLCDTAVLATLPEEEYRCGCAEIIKYGVLGNRQFFDSVSRIPIKEQYEEVIETCVTMKRQVVEADEFDRGERMKLNLGHTIGHAAEGLSGFQILHGQAVAMGMAAVMRIAVAQGVCDPGALQELLQVLQKYGLPAEIPYTADQMLQLMLTDKKMAAGSLNVILPEAIGSCRIGSVAAEDLKDWLALGGIL